MACTKGHEWKFGKDATALKVVAGHNLEGRYAIVTGSNTGIGFEKARALASVHCHVVLACRDMQKAGVAVEKIKKEFPHAKVEAMKLDLSSFAAIKKFADEYLEKNYPLHILLLNAGVMVEKYQQSADGYEITYHTNHLAQMYLTQLLEAKLVASAPSRVVIVSSRIGLASPEFLSKQILNEGFFVGDATNFNGLYVYGVSKCLNALYGQELHRHLEGRGVSVFYIHPGFIHTNLQENTDLGKKWVSSLPADFRGQHEKTLEEGASNSVYCAVEKGLEPFSGQYFIDCQPAEVPAFLLDPELAKHLWTLSEELIAKKTH